MNVAATPLAQKGDADRHNHPEPIGCVAKWKGPFHFATQPPKEGSAYVYRMN